MLRIERLKSEQRQNDGREIESRKGKIHNFLPFLFDLFF